MNRISNPYNIHALYSYYNPWDIGRQCPMFCPTTNLPPTQLMLPTSSSGASFSADIVNPDTGFELDVSANVSKACTTGGTFFTYSDSDLASDLDEGVYQLRLVVNGIEYWGYPYCALDAYQSGTPTLSVSANSSGAGNYTHTYAITAGSQKDDFAYKYEYNIGSGWVTFGQASGVITQDDWSPSGTITGYIRLSAYRGNSSAYRLYAINFNTAAPTLIIPQYEGEGGTGQDAFASLQWSNANDLQNYGIYYAGGYTQKFYFEGHPGHSTPIIQENFIENGENGLFLEGGITAEQQNLDFFPVPDHGAAVLASVRMHDTINMNAQWQGGSESNIVNFNFSPTEIEGSLCRSGRFSWERNRQYIGGCQEDYTTTTCP